MKAVAKWFAASGALLLVLGFLLPVISITSPGTRTSISLFQIAGVSRWFFLYLVPIFAVGIMLLPFIPANDQTTKTVFLIGQAAALGAAVLFIFGMLIYLFFRPQLWQDAAGLGQLLPAGVPTVQPTMGLGLGLLILFLGIGLAAFGVVMDILPLLGSRVKTETKQEDQSAAPPLEEETKSPIKHVYLEGKKGAFTGQKFFLKEDNFSIGRGRDNDLQLSDKKVSRLHTRIRHSQGAWFVQDQDSKIGTLVNGKAIDVTRLNTGDSIKIGDDIFIFYSQ